MSRPFKRPESVLVLVYTVRAEVLLLRRVRPPGSYWQSVTGSLKWHESARDAAIRELAEETGIAGVEPVDCHRTNRFPVMAGWGGRFAPGVHENTEHVYRVELPEPAAVTLAPHEHRDCAWLSRDDALTRVFSWTNRDAIRVWVTAP